MIKKLSAFDIKLIAIIFMVIDHVRSFLGFYLHLPVWTAFLGRFVAPVFLYFIMEGYKHTRDRKNYLVRLLKGSAVMFAVNLIFNVLNGSYINRYTGEFSFVNLVGGHNIFWTFSLIIILFMILDNIIGKTLYHKIVQILLLILLLPALLMSEGGMYLLPMALACYFFDNDVKKVSLSLILWSAILLVKSVLSYYTIPNPDFSLYTELTFSNEFMMATAIPFLFLYNGERGGSGKKWQKNMFYIFYPLHLILLYCLTFFFPSLS